MKRSYRTTTGRIHIEQIARHRNGVAGAPFCVIKFTEGKDRKLAVVFEEPWHVAVFDRALLAEDVIAFGLNSWRGDHYDTALRLAIVDHYADMDAKGAA